MNVLFGIRRAAGGTAAMAFLVAALVDFILAALEFYLFVAVGHHWWSAAAAGFCGGLGVALVMAWWFDRLREKHRDVAS